MFSKDEEKELRKDFWGEFDSYCRKRGRKAKWMLQDTGIKAVNLKFDVDRLHAIVGVDIVSRDLERRIYYYEKFESLKTTLTEKLGDGLIWDLEFQLTEKRNIARIYVMMHDVDIYDRTTWEKIWLFFFDNMDALERVYSEYIDFIRYQADYGTN